MKTYGLVGKSGTGKSYRALNLCKEKNIECIIDDGLFISSSQILAGKSAKRQPTVIGAIKTALFTEKEHRNSVIEMINEVNPSAILVIGTSLGMLAKIRERLELPEFFETIKIEDISNPEDMETARKERKEKGKHVIPVPIMQLKKEFSGYLMDPLKVFRGLGIPTWGKMDGFEKSVVRPTYSYLGKFKISEKAMFDIVHIIAKTSSNISYVGKVTINNKDAGIRVSAEIFMNNSENIVSVTRDFQNEVKKQLENMTLYNILTVSVQIKGVK